jgi:glucosamine--fructose-6-phosphate aminotransferase (isomerizing)
MRSEIFEQPAALRATIGALLPRTAEVAALAQDARQVLFFARGTSDNAAVYGTYLIQTRTGRLASLGSPSVATTYRSRIDLSGVMAVGLSQSGRTEEIIETLQWARDCGASVVGITNGAGSPLADWLTSRLSPRQARTGRSPPPRRSLPARRAGSARDRAGRGSDAGQLTRLR